MGDEVMQIHIHGDHSPPRHAQPDQHNIDQWLVDILDGITETLTNLEITVTAFIEAQPAIDAVTAQLTDAQGKVTQLTTDKAAADAKAADLQTQLDAANATVAQLQADASNQTLNLQPLQDAATALDSTVA